MHKRHRRALQIYLPTCIVLRKMIDAAFFVMPCVEGNPITMWCSDTNTHTHTCACTHTLFRNYDKGRVVLFFLSLFSIFFLMLTSTLVSLAIHLVFSSCGTQAQTHYGTNKQTNTHTQQSRLHVRPCTETCVPVRLVCNNLSTPLNVYGGAVVYHFLEQHSFLFSFPLGSLLPFSLPSVSFSQVNPPVRVLLVVNINLHVFLFRQIYNGERVLWETFEEACLPHTLSLSLSLSFSLSLSLSLSPYLSLSLSFLSPFSLSLSLSVSSLSLSLSLSPSLPLSLSLPPSLSPLSLSLSLSLSSFLSSWELSLSFGLFVCQLHYDEHSDQYFTTHAGSVVAAASTAPDTTPKVTQLETRFPLFSVILYWGKKKNQDLLFLPWT